MISWAVGIGLGVLVLCLLIAWAVGSSTARPVRRMAQVHEGSGFGQARRRRSRPGPRRRDRRDGARPSRPSKAAWSRTGACRSSSRRCQQRASEDRQEGAQRASPPASRREVSKSIGEMATTTQEMARSAQAMSGTAQATVPRSGAVEHTAGSRSPLATSSRSPRRSRSWRPRSARSASRSTARARSPTARPTGRAARWSGSTPWCRRPEQIGVGHYPDQRHRQPDQPAGAQRDDRGGARRRGRQGLRGGGLRGEEPRHADRRRRPRRSRPRCRRSSNRPAPRRPEIIGDRQDHRADQPDRRHCGRRRDRAGSGNRRDQPRGDAAATGTSSPRQHPERAETACRSGQTASDMANAVSLVGQRCDELQVRVGEFLKRVRAG